MAHFTIIFWILTSAGILTQVYVKEYPHCHITPLNVLKWFVLSTKISAWTIFSHYFLHFLLFHRIWSANDCRSCLALSPLSSLTLLLYWRVACNNNIDWKLFTEKTFSVLLISSNIPLQTAQILISKLFSNYISDRSTSFVMVRCTALDRVTVGIRYATLHGSSKL